MTVQTHARETSGGDSAVERLVEELGYQTDLSARILAELRHTNCRLEQLAGDGGRARDELHRHSALHADLRRLLAYQVEIARAAQPGLATLLDCKYGFERCFELGDGCALPPPCPPRPCPGDTPPGRGEGESKTGRAPPRHVEGAPYPPVRREDNPARQPNTRPYRTVPDGPFRGVLRRGPAAALRELTSGNPQAAGIDFPVWTADPGGASASTNAADVSGAKGGQVVMMSGNWWVDVSTDAGATFTRLNPTTIFPETLAGGFCCDQILQYAPRIDRFLWLLQYRQAGGGPNAYRLAAASPEEVVASGGTAWTFWDLPSAGFGLGSDWMDYPSMSLGDNEVYLSFDVLDSSADTLADNGLVVVRLPLAEIAARGTVNYRFTNAADSAVAWGSGVSADTGDEVFWAGHVDNSTLRVFSWRADSTSYAWRDVELRNWPNAALASSGPNGNNWFGWGFPGNAVIGIARRGGELWLAWTASAGDGGGGGFSFPHPHVQLVRLEIGGWRVIEQTQVWNPDHAFGYPSLATNADGEVGIALGWGGGGTLHANSAVGFLGDHVVWFRDGSTWTHTRWGDYVAIRRAQPESRMFAAFGFVTVDTSTPTAASHRFDPYYVLFGRSANEPPPIR